MVMTRTLPLTHPRPPPRIHGVVGMLCAFMLFWVAVLPGTWKGMISRQQAQSLEDAIPSFVPLQKNFTSKHSTHPAVQALHILPSIVWAGVIPWQLDESFRKKHRFVHQLCGSLLMCSVVALAAGYVLMEQRGLLHGMGGPFESRPQVWLMRGATCWFLFTAAKSVYWAVNRKFSSHRVWVYRHIASGIWVAVLRLLVAGSALLHFAGLVDWSDEGNKVLGFQVAFVIAYALCTGWCELVVLRDLRREQVRSVDEKAMRKKD